MYYTPSEVKEIIFDYSWITRLVESNVYDDDSVSIGSYGVESSMPKAQGGTSDKVLVKVLQNERQRNETEKLVEKLQFIDEHEHLITNLKNYHILQLIKRGESITRIEVLIDISRKNIHNRVGQIVTLFMEAQEQ